MPPIWSVFSTCHLLLIETWMCCRQVEVLRQEQDMSAKYREHASNSVWFYFWDCAACMTRVVCVCVALSPQGWRWLCASSVMLFSPHWFGVGWSELSRWSSSLAAGQRGGLFQGFRGGGFPPQALSTATTEQRVMGASLCSSSDLVLPSSISSPEQTSLSLPSPCTVSLRLSSLLSTYPLLFQRIYHLRNVTTLFSFYNEYPYTHKLQSSLLFMFRVLHKLLLPFKASVIKNSKQLN